MDDHTNRDPDEYWKRQALAHGWIPPEAQSIWLENQRLKWEREQDQTWSQQPQQPPRSGHGCLWAFLISATILVTILVMVWHISASVVDRGTEIDRHTTRPTTSATK